MKKMKEMPDHARVWVYAADKSLSAIEQAIMMDKTEDFLGNWSSHGAAIDAAYEIVHNRILIIAVDETQVQASGCGIDKQVHFIKKLGTEHGMDFMNRTLVLYERDGILAEATLHQFWAERKALIISDETKVVDTTIRTVGELRTSLVKSFRDSWHAEMWGR
jgi:hypothetical protein